MNAQEFKSIILFMANHWDKDTAIEIFGEVMGNHFFSKWAAPKDPDLGTMRLFYEMSTDNLQKLLNYIESYNQYLEYKKDNPDTEQDEMRKYWNNEVRLGHISKEDAQRIIDFEDFGYELSKELKNK